MTRRIADARNNPFTIEDTSTPPMRSAFAVLAADRAELEGRSIEEILERARALMRKDPELATVYGRAIDSRDLDVAAERLTDASARVVNELLDFEHHHFDLSGLDELGAAVADYRKRLSATDELELRDLSLLAALLEDLASEIPDPGGAAFTVSAPEIPRAADLLDDLA